MVAHVGSVAFRGIDALDVDIQVQITNGLPALTIVGLPDKAVAESRERIRSALHALGLSLPPKRITINLAPADLMKEGAHYDLPIALGLLIAMNVVPQDALENYLVLGELSLDAKIRSSGGTLPAAIHAVSKDYNIICASEAGNEARWAGEIEVLACDDLLRLINHFKGTQLLAPVPAPDITAIESVRGAARDVAEIKGQESAKRALLIAAAGRHNMLMLGPPGSGKSMLASCLPGILPPLTPSEALETSMIHSIAGILPENGLMQLRPFRAPHHSATLPALVGGGQKAKPGEISLSHHGVLFLDELPEFSRNAIESLRQPIESGEVVIARANHHISYPASFQLIAAMNPCRCGHLGNPEFECSKAPRCAEDYQAKISGPLLDRFDLHVDVPAVSVSDLDRPASKEGSEAYAARVEQAQNRQIARQGKLNHALSARDLDDVMEQSGEAKELLSKAAAKMSISARGYHRLIRLARTIADLEGCEDMGAQHIAEALSYRKTRLV